MRIVKPPEDLGRGPTPVATRMSPGWRIFLAGSIEMGTAAKWQMVAERLIYIHEYKDHDTVVFNPRRDDWDAKWEQGSKEMVEQVQWELEALEISDFVLMYFDPATKSPISLLELGLYAKGSGKLVVVCPEGFYRKTNVDVVCKKYHIKQFPSIEEAIIKYIFPPNNKK